MSKRRTPRHRWHVGDVCLRPWYNRGHVGGWEPGRIVAVRGDRAVVLTYHRWENEHPYWELRVPPRPIARWRT